METNNKPATALPWVAQDFGHMVEIQPRGDDPEGLATVNAARDARYIVHAANAYPELVAALRGFTYADSNRDKMPADIDAVNLANARAILAKLGE